MNGILMDRPVKAIVNTVLVPLESYLWLQQEGFRQRNERGQTELSEKAKERLSRSFEQHSYNGLYAVHDGNFGGCNGDPHHAYEEGRWTSWTVKQIAKMLDEHGLPYKMGEPVEVMYL